MYFSASVVRDLEGGLKSEPVFFLLPGFIRLLFFFLLFFFSWKRIDKGYVVGCLLLSFVAKGVLMGWNLSWKGGDMMSDVH